MIAHLRNYPSTFTVTRSGNLIAMCECRRQIQSQVVGLRYFNVYGPQEQHKGSMATVAFHFMNQLNVGGRSKIIRRTEGYTDGGQLRDFIFVDDVVKVNLWFLRQPTTGAYF